MKNLASVLFLSLLLSTSSARAFDIGKILDKAKQVVDENAKSAKEAADIANNGIKVSNSKYEFRKALKQDTKWVMLMLTKDSAKEQLVLPAINGSASMNLYLKNGPGTYNLQVYESADIEKYTNTYYATQSLKLNNTDSRDLKFLLPSLSVQSDNEEIIALAKKITEGASSDLDAIKKIHVYVAKTIKYDYDAYYNGSYATKEYDALSTLKSRVAVCAGYSNLYAALARAVGIRTKIIYGLGFNGTSSGGEQHAWNEVLIDNEWKAVDATWDSTTNMMFKYFMIPQEIFEKDHQKEKEMTDL